MRALALAALLCAGCFDYDFLSRNVGATIDAGADDAAPRVPPPAEWARHPLVFGAARIIQTPRATTLCTVLGDVDGDGDLDLVAPDYDSSFNGALELYRNDGSGGFTFATGYDTSAGGPQIAVAGLIDQNSVPDVAVGNFGTINASIDLFHDVGGASSTDSAIPLPSPGIEALALADFDGDGKLDLAAGDASGNQILFLQGHGDGTFAAGAPFVSSSPETIATADFDADGVADIAVAEYVSENVAVFFGDKLAPFTRPPFRHHVPHPVMVIAADLDSDGHIDLALTSNSGGVSILWGRGDGSFDPGPVVDVGNDFNYGLAAADLDRDGHVDLVVADTIFSSGPPRVRVLLGEGVRGFAPPRELLAIGGAEWLSIADLDGDGWPDLIVPSSANDSRILILLNRTGR